ncbi:hypothetical protein [Pollutibacter soli]|uniref:hypothetical protein n=1 Tax=Pollutibacter soli TaxID=3034157 RepID=UPI003014036E
MENKGIDPIKHKYTVGDIRHSTFELNFFLKDINMRLNDLEFAQIKPEENRELTRAAKILLLNELGIIQFLFDKKYSQKNISKILSTLINAHNSNIETNLTERNSSKASFKSRQNYQQIVEKMNQLGVKPLEQHFEEILSSMPEDF